MDGLASCAAMTPDGSSVVPELQKGHLAGSHMRGCNLANAPAAHIGAGPHMHPYLEAARKSPGLEEVAAAFACCAEVVAETDRMNIALQDDSHLMEQRCCMVLA